MSGSTMGFSGKLISYSFGGNSQSIHDYTDQSTNERSQGSVQGPTDQLNRHPSYTDRQLAWHLSDPELGC